MKTGRFIWTANHIAKGQPQETGLR
jgi:hypothetical protein